jgi:hypothetical protein
MRNSYTNLVEKLQRRAHLPDIGMDGKRIFGKGLKYRELGCELD